MSHRRTWGVAGLDGQQHLQVRLLAQCGDKIKYVYEYYMTYLRIYWLLLSSTQPPEHLIVGGGRRDTVVNLQPLTTYNKNTQLGQETCYQTSHPGQTTGHT